jgi:hypothetical protein
VIEINEHDGHATKVATVIVNGRSKEVTAKELTFDDVVRLAYDNPDTGPDITYSISYRRGVGNKPSGRLAPGGSVKVKDGMIFNVKRSDRS